MSCEYCDEGFKVRCPTCKAEHPIQLKGAQYVGTLPTGYEWRFMDFKGNLKVVGCHPTEGVKIFRLDGLTLVEEQIKFDPEPPTVFNGVELASIKTCNEMVTQIVKPWTITMKPHPKDFNGNSSNNPKSS